MLTLVFSMGEKTPWELQFPLGRRGAAFGPGLSGLLEPRSPWQRPYFSAYGGTPDSPKLRPLSTALCNFCIWLLSILHTSGFASAVQIGIPAMKNGPTRAVPVGFKYFELKSKKYGGI
jgi:hypothetical protein